MTAKLSHMFFGDKKFKKEHFDLSQLTSSLPDEEISDLFQPYTHQLLHIKSRDGATSLLPIFCEFVRQNFNKFSTWQF